MQNIFDTAVNNFRDTIRLALMHTDDHQALIVFDTNTEFCALLAEAVKTVLPGAKALNFDETKPEDVRGAIEALKPRDLVILLQSTNFRLNEFRFRLELFKRELKTLEIAHLQRILPHEQHIFVDSLFYDPEYYRPLGRALNEKIKAAKTFTVRCAGTELRYDTPMEPVKFNIGDYRDMKNIGGTFPIGEIFTEPQDLAKVNGEIMIHALGDLDHKVITPDPFKAVIQNGILTAPEAPAEFQKTLALISEQEPVLVREFGLGLNKAMNKQRIVSNITAYERMNGLHFSLGAKHGVYKKPGLSPKKTRYHIDIFVDAQEILADDEIIFANGIYLP